MCYSLLRKTSIETGGAEVEKQTLREQRKAKGLSIARLAVISGVSRSVISDYERGTKKPGLDKARRLAEVLEVPLDSLGV